MVTRITLIAIAVIAGSAVTAEFNDPLSERQWNIRNTGRAFCETPER